MSHEALWEAVKEINVMSAAMENVHPAVKMAHLAQAIMLLRQHLEAQEQRPPLSNVLTSEITPESLERWKALTPSASTSPSQSGVWLSASVAANLADWLQRFLPLTTTGGFRLTVQPGSVTFSAWDGAGALTIPTGTPEPPSTSGSEQGEPGDRGQALVDADIWRGTPGTTVPISEEEWRWGDDSARPD